MDSEVKEWAKQCRLNGDGVLQTPSAKISSFIWTYTRAKERCRYIQDDVVLDVASVSAFSKDRGPEPMRTEVEVTSKCFLEWSEKFQQGVKADFPNVDWELLFDTAWNIKGRIEEELRYQRVKGSRSWHSSASLDRSSGEVALLDPTEEDLKKVFDSFMVRPVPGKEIANVKVIKNSVLASSFKSRLALLQERYVQHVFDPKWKTEKNHVLRKQVNDRFLQLTEKFSDAGEEKKKKKKKKRKIFDNPQPNYKIFRM